MPSIGNVVIKIDDSEIRVVFQIQLRHTVFGTA